MLFLRTFGGLALERDGIPVPGAGGQRARLALLAIIASAGQRGIARERLQSILWPETDTERARGNLKQAMFGLRTATGVKDLLVGVDEIRLNPETISVDRWEFESALDAGDLNRAVEVHTGRFLDAVALRNNPEFDRWKERENDLLTARYHGALRQLAEEAHAAKLWTDEVRWLRMLAAADPLNSSVAAALIRAFASAGDSASALRHARVHGELVQDELGAEVDPQITAAVRGIHEVNSRASEAGNGRNGATVDPQRIGASDGAVEVVPTVEPAAAITETSASVRSDAASPYVSPRRSPAFRSTLLAACVLIAAVGVAVASPLVRDPVSDRVMVVRGDGSPVRAGSACARLSLEERIVDGIVRLRFATVVSDRPRYLITLDCREESGQLVVAAQLQDAVRGSTEAAFVEHASPSDAGAALDAVESRVMAHLAARLHPRLRRWSASAELPESWAAVRELTLGLEAWGQGRYEDATALLKQSASRDTTSATALTIAALMTHGSRDVVASARTRPRLGAWERAMLARLQFVASGDFSGAHAAAHHLMTVAPGSEWAWLLVVDAFSEGRVSEALRVLRSMKADARSLIDPTEIAKFESGALHLLGEHVEELKVARAARRVNPENRTLIQWEAKALAALGRTAEVEALCVNALSLRARSGWSEAQPCHQSILELAAHGQPEAARRLQTFYTTTLAAAPESERASRWTWEDELLAESGQFEEAERRMRSNPRFDSTDMVYVGVALWSAAAQGNRSQVQQLLQRQAVISPWKPGTGDESFARAEVAALLGDRDAAVLWLQRSFREGWRHRGYVHIDPALRRMRGYGPWEALVKPVEDPAHESLLGR